ncbi:MAG: toll/interleukin-1 receptor domain-containing protein [Sandarakinorhabdus sp.]|nr:toll/interleukin-1 receptor domain-containing protein [Sandarakinorhabdus sp.]
MAQIFISYSSADEAIAREVYNELRVQGFGSVFLSADRDDGIRPGEDWERRIYGQLRACVLVLPLLSTRWLASPWCHAELRIGRFLGKKIYPVLVERCGLEGVAPELQHIDISLERDGLSTLGSRLHAQLGRRRTRWSGGCPFPGLEAFDETHSGVFFGRDAEIQRLTERVRAIARGAPTDENSRALILSGPSGVGKSSLMRAGVIPELRQHASENILVLPVVRPRADLAGALSGSLAALLAEVEQRKLARADIAAAREALASSDPAAAVAALLADCMMLAGAGDGVLLPIDQGEELLIGPEAHVTAQLALLSALMRQDRVPLTVMATARSSEAVALASRLGGEIITTPQLSAACWREVVEGPLEAAGVEVEEGFVDAVQRDAAGAADALPLVAHLMTRLWHGDGFTSAAYRATGGLAASVAEAAEAVWQSFAGDPETGAAIRRAFVPLLASVGADGTPMLSRLPVDRAPTAAQPALRAFVERRLLRISDLDGDRVYEASHEALLRRWPRLTEWLSQSREALLAVEALRTAAAAWEQADRADDYLDHRGDRLLAVEQAAADPDVATKIATMAGVSDYLEACRTAEAARASEAERHREALEARERRLVPITVGLYAAEAQRANDTGNYDRALRFGLSGWSIAAGAGIDPPPALMAQLARAAFHDRLLRAFPKAANSSYDQISNDGTFMFGQSHTGVWTGLNVDSGASERFDRFEGVRRVRLYGDRGWIGHDPETGHLVHGVFHGNEDRVSLIAMDGLSEFSISPSGNHLIVSDRSHTATMYALPGCEQVWRQENALSDLYRLVAFDDGRALMVSEQREHPSQVVYWSSQGEIILSLALPFGAEAAQLDISGRRLCLAGRKSGGRGGLDAASVGSGRMNGQGLMLDLQTGEKSYCDLEMLEYEFAAAVLWDRGALRYCSQSGRLDGDPLPLTKSNANLFWAVPQLGAIASLEAVGMRLWTASPRALSFSIDGDVTLPGFIRRNGASTIVLGNRNGEEISPCSGDVIARHHNWSCDRSAELLRANGNTDLVRVGRDGSVFRLDSVSGEVNMLARASESFAIGKLERVVASPDGKAVLCVGNAGWRMVDRAGSEIALFENADGDENAVDIRDGTFEGQRALLAMIGNGNCYIHDASTGELLSTINSPGIGDVAFLGGGRLLMKGDSARVCEWKTGAVIGPAIDLVFRGHEPIVVSPDGRRAILSRQLWDLAAGVPLANIDMGRDSGTFSADGHWLAWNRHDGGLAVVDARWFTLDGDVLIAAICAERLQGAEAWWPGDLAGSTAIDPPANPVAAARELLQIRAAR